MERHFLFSSTYSTRVYEKKTFSCVKNLQPFTLRARGGGLISIALDIDKGSEFETFRIGVSVLCSLARYFTLTVSLSFNLGAQMDTYETLGKLESFEGLPLDVMKTQLRS